jgi:hypothetical protein
MYNSGTTIWYLKYPKYLNFHVYNYIKVCMNMYLQNVFVFYVHVYNYSNCVFLLI